jgi:hypothetical protein
MSNKWYYVDAGERKGPVEESFIQELISQNSLKEDDYVWRKGFENWVKIKEVGEFELLSDIAEATQVLNVHDISVEINKVESYSLGELAGQGNSIFIKIGSDRGGQEVEYGPYSLEIIKKLFSENRVSPKTFIFIKGMNDWILLADFTDFSNIFNDDPPPIEDDERRSNKRKPFIARMYIQNKREIYVGICRDISVGGMQVLVDHFPGKENERISINVHPENTDYHFVASGNIVRLLDGGQGFSFRFLELSSDSKGAITKYLENA